MLRLKPLGLAAIIVGCAPLATIGQEHVYFGNLHSHTSLSDGSGTPDQAYRHARYIADIDFLAITEHSRFQDPRE